MSEQELAVEQTETVASEDDALGEVWDRLAVDEDSEPKGPERGPDGKFVSAKDSPENEAPGGGEGGAAEAESPEASPSVEVSAAPAHLPQAIKNEWNKIPEAARTEMARLTTEWDRKFGEIGRQMESVRPIAEKLTRASQEYPEFQGMTADQLADGALELAAVQTRLARDPVSTILEVANHYGVTAMVAEQLTGQRADPSTAALHQEIAQLRQQLAQPQITPDIIEAQISQAIEQRETQAAVEAFSQESPYFGDVEHVMPHFVQMVREEQSDMPVLDVLRTAYDMAINAVPAVRDKIRASEGTTTAAKINPERAEAAKRAASINVKSNANGKVRSLTEEELMASAYDRAMAN